MDLLHGLCCGLSQSSFDDLFFYLFVCFCFVLSFVNKKREKSEKYKNSVCFV